MRASEAIFRVGFEQLGHVPFGSLDRHGAGGARHGPAAELSQRLRPGRAPRQGRALRTVLSFHPLLVGGNPFAASSIYSLIAFLERNWGVHFAMGGTGRLVQRPGAA